MSEGFLDILKKRGYHVSGKKLGGGFVNDVNLITATKGGETYQYVLKKYGTKNDFNDMLRGYDSIAGIVHTPTIVYTNRDNNEVAYDLVKGKSIKSMIEDRDPAAPEAMKILAQEIERLHKSKRYNPHFHKDDSPDEKKVRGHTIRLHFEGRLDRKELEKVQRAIREYKPSNKRVIHGDAHLGNFIYSNHRLYVI